MFAVDDEKAGSLFRSGTFLLASRGFKRDVRRSGTFLLGSRGFMQARCSIRYFSACVVSYKSRFGLFLRPTVTVSSCAGEHSFLLSDRLKKLVGLYPPAFAELTEAHGLLFVTGMRANIPKIVPPVYF